MRNINIYDDLMKKPKNFCGNIIINGEKSEYVVIKINNFIEKYLNLIKLSWLPKNVFFYFPGKKGINTFFLNFHSNAIFIDNNHDVINISYMKYNTFSKYYGEASSCLLTGVNINILKELFDHDKVFWSKEVLKQDIF